MNPTLISISDEGDICKFTIANLNVSLANALRRTILSDIPTLGFYTEQHETNLCTVHVNTTRLHNEIIKHRLSCIPVHMKELDILPGKYILEVDEKNDTDSMVFVTTEHFRIRNKENDHFLTKEEVRKIFPPSKQNRFIDFARLQGKVADAIPGGQLKLTAEFSVHTAKNHSMYNVVSKCAYGNTQDASKIADIWQNTEDDLRSSEVPAAEIEFRKRNFNILDAQRHFVPDSFDFIMQTIGVYENREIIRIACKVLNDKMVDLLEAIESDTVPILNSESTMDSCYDIILEHEDYTIGKVIEYILYERYYVTEKSMSYCGFKKFHPHNPDSTLRVSYVQSADKQLVKQHLYAACVDARDTFVKISQLFA